MADAAGNPPEPGELTRLLARAQAGDLRAESQFIEEVHPELRKLAGAYMRRERSDHSWQPTEVVHEAFIKLRGLNRIRYEDRKHFFGVAARLMRQILVDHARKKLAEVHGGGVKPQPLDEELVMIDGRQRSNTDILAINQALDRYEKIDPDAAQVVDLRFFGGLSIEETAAVIDKSPRTVRRHWTIGRAWLYRELSGSPPSASGVRS